MKKVYFYRDQYGEYCGPYETVQGMLNEIRDYGLDPEKCKCYEAVEGTYIPPSTPETVYFPKER